MRTRVAAPGQVVHAPGSQPGNGFDVYGTYTACGQRFTGGYAAGGGWTGFGNGEYVAGFDAATCPPCLEKK